MRGCVGGRGEFCRLTSKVVRIVEILVLKGESGDKGKRDGEEVRIEGRRIRVD